MKPLLPLFLLPFLFAGCGSSLKAVISDANGLHREVGAVRLDSGRFLQVFDGLALRQVPLKKVSIIRISPDETKTYDNQLYFLAEIWLTDGNKIQSYTLSDGRESKAFVKVDCSLLGRIDRARYVIRMSDVRQVKIVRE